MTTQELKQQTDFTSAYNEYKHKLISYAYMKVHNRALSEDIVQITFMKTWMYMIRNGKIHLMKSFLYHTLNDLVIDEYRRRKTTSLDELLENGFEPRSTDHERPYDGMDGKKALALIDKLPTKYRKVMQLRYKEGLSLGEISENIGEAKNTVAVQAHRGLLQLKKLYQI